MAKESVGEEYSLTWNGHTRHIQESFTRLLARSDFCDVTLYVEGRKIGAHKVFLSSCSEYFEELLKVLKDEHPIVVLKGVRFNILQQILQFIYNGQVSIEIENLDEFLEAAKFLKIIGLTKDKILRKRRYSYVGEVDQACNTDLDHEYETSQETVRELHSQYSQQSSSKPDVNQCLSDEQIFKELTIPPFIKFHKKLHMKPRTDNSPNRTLSQDSVTKKSMTSPVCAITRRSHDDGSFSLIRESQCDSPPSILKKRKSRSQKGRSVSLERIKETEPIEEFARALDAEIAPMASKTEEGFQCNICNKVYMKKDSLKKHFSTHTQNTTCHVCGLTLSRKSHLKRHRSKVHGATIN